jgi:hypothetical protein
MSIPRLQRWFDQLIEGMGANLFRYKGLVNVMGTDARFVYQVCSVQCARQLDMINIESCCVI